MGAGHAIPVPARPLPVHRLPAEVKVVAALLGAVSWWPRREALGCSRVPGGARRGVGRPPSIPAGWILRRAVIELPFVVLAVLLRCSRPDPRIDVLGVALSEPGLLGAWNIVVKGTLGVLISLTLAATTPLRDLLQGMQRLHAPALVVTIATLMLRYADLIVEAGRMRRAGCPRPRPAVPVAGRHHRPRDRRAVHPRLRARRAGTPRHALPRVRRGAAASGRGRQAERQWVTGLAPAGVAVLLAAAGWSVA